MSEVTELTYEMFEGILNSKMLLRDYKNISAAQFNMSEVDLVEQLRPTKLDWRLRIRFWDLIAKVLDKTNRYNLIYNIDICEGITDSKHFQKKIKSEIFLNFLFRPIEKFTDELEIMLTVTRHKMWVLMNALQPVTEKGDVDYKAASMLMNIHDKLVDRKMGTAKQLIEMRKISMNVKHGYGFSDDLEHLDHQIQNLRGELEPPTSRTIEVDADEKGTSH